MSFSEKTLALIFTMNQSFCGMYSAPYLTLRVGFRKLFKLLGGGEVAVPYLSVV